MVPAAGSPAATALAEDLPRARSDLQLLLHLTGQVRARSPWKHCKLPLEGCSKA